MNGPITSRVRSIFMTIADVFRAFTRKGHRRFLLLLPVLLLLALLLAIVSSSGALAPFVYPLF